MVFFFNSHQQFGHMTFNQNFQLEFCFWVQTMLFSEFIRKAISGISIKNVYFFFIPGLTLTSIINNGMISPLSFVPLLSSFELLFFLIMNCHFLALISWTDYVVSSECPLKFASSGTRRFFLRF